MTNLEKQSKLDTLRYDTNKYLGDGFEFFIELFLNLHSVDNRIGIYKYEPIQLNDNGVDGIGININGNKSVIQIKYRTNTNEYLSSNKDNLSNLFSDGMLTHNVVSNEKDIRHFIFTTAKGLHFYTEQEMFKNKVKCFGYNEIKQLINNNFPFWDSCRKVIKNLN